MLLKSLLARLAQVLALTSASGCGPMHMPMTPRLDADEQEFVDDAWNHAAKELPRVDHQQLLDALMTSLAYQIGVDRLSLRSEKHCDAGLVVMEIRSDRADPSADCFTFTLYDNSGEIVRHERYSRDDVERTYEELFVELGRLEGGVGNGTLPADDQRRRETLQARRDAASSLLPEVEEEGEPKRE